jgi:hypothetical protein
MHDHMTQPWPVICQLYAEWSTTGLPSLAAMYDLVHVIEQSRYASDLFAWTSMHDLCIVQLPVSYPHAYPYLRISPKSDSLLEFRYIDTAIQAQQWSRTVEGTQGFARLERFLEQLHWFPPNAERTNH